MAQELLDDDQLNRPLREWLRMLHEFAVVHPQFEDPMIQRAMNEAINRQFPVKLVRDFTLRDLRVVYQSLRKDGVDSVVVRAMLAFADECTVLHTLRSLRQHFGW